jgi:hypothetical protein
VVTTPSSTTVPWRICGGLSTGTSQGEEFNPLTFRKFFQWSVDEEVTAV